MIPIQDRMRGVAQMLAGREGWRSNFDVSPGGFRESFLAAIPAAPFFLLSVAGQNLVSTALANPETGPRTVGPIQGVIVYLLFWTYFPLVTRALTRALDMEDAFAPWVVLHNWTALAMLGIQGTIGALLLTGILTPLAYAEFVGVTYLMLAIYAHCRVAMGAMEAPWPLVIGATCVPILVWLIMQLVLMQTFEGAALQP